MRYCRYKIFPFSGSAQALFLNFKDDRLPFLLESGRGAAGQGRYSFFSSGPFLVLRVVNGKCFKEEDGLITAAQGFPLDVLRQELGRYRLEGKCRHNFPFLCGAVGFFSYDFGFSFEKIKKNHVDATGVPDFVFGFYDWVVGLDHFKKEMIVFSSGFPQKNSTRAAFAESRLKSVLNRLKVQPLKKRLAARDSFCRKEDLVSDFSKNSYLKAIAKIKEHIARGDIYQANLSQRFKTRLAIDDWRLYGRLAKRLPVSFSAFFKDGPMSIISASPEMFLEFDGRVVSTRPMKGTRPRTANRVFNRKLKQALIRSPKEKAELLMIVDLERNDLGRVCEYGSVRVSKLRRIESYKSVFQAVAQIDGVLHKGKDRLDLIRACFPGGSVTGAPKIRAMEIIDSLEPHARGIYTGSLGFLSFHNTLEFNILIRSFLKYHDDIFFNVGGGIVTDSKPQQEYEETLVKAKALMEALSNP